MEIVRYEDKYLDDVRDLLTELEEYIASIDYDELDRVHPDFHDKMAILDLREIEDKQGMCYLAIEKNKVVGLIMGIIPTYHKYDYLDFKCPKRGKITELVITDQARNSGVGQKLIEKMEKYFKDCGCEYSYVDIFAYNNAADRFYKKNGYHTRRIVDLKKL